MFYLTTHSTHFIYGYMASDIWLRTIQIVREETRCRHIGYSYRLTASVLLYAPSHRQDNTYHGLCYTSRGALAGTRNSSMGPYRVLCWAIICGRVDCGCSMKETEKSNTTKRNGKKETLHSFRLFLSCYFFPFLSFLFLFFCFFLSYKQGA